MEPERLPAIPQQAESKKCRIWEKIATGHPASILPVISTQRMCLRPFVMEDLSGLQEILGDKETMEQLEPPYTLQQTEAFLQKFCIQGQKALAAVRRTDETLIGYLLYKSWGDPQLYELAWIFRKNCWRQGYGFEAVSRLIAWAFTEGDAKKLFAETIDPLRSARLMEKLGMVREGLQRQHVRDQQGQWKDLYLYGMTKEDWIAQNEGERTIS